MKLGKCQRWHTKNENNTRLQIEENVGEDIHIHFRNLRFEFTKDEFKEFASAVTEAQTRIEENANTD